MSQSAALTALRESLGGAQSLGAAFNILRASFRAAGLDSPSLDARLLIAHAFAVDTRAVPLWRETPVAGLPAAAVPALCEAAWRRLSHEPVARITGRRGFWSIELAVTPDVLDPRADTETVVEVALEHARKQGWQESRLRILDLGTGTGAILLALLTELPNATGIGIDISAAAAATAEANAASLGLTGRASFTTLDFSGLPGDDPGPFSLIVSNPPYIPAGDIAALAPDVRDFDPRIALDGGQDGLDAFRQIFHRIGPILAPEGAFIGEFGIGQASSVAAIARDSGFSAISIHRDLAGRDRVIKAVHGR